MGYFPVSNSMTENQIKHDIQNSTATFAVLQSVADFQPDVDAIYRLTRTTPFSFKRPEPFIPAPVVQKGTKGIKSIISIINAR